jgi:hypothetical protein
VALQTGTGISWPGFSAAQGTAFVFPAKCTISL